MDIIQKYCDVIKELETYFFKPIKILLKYI